MNNDCIFCRIVRGELPSTRIFEDDKCIAFMDIAPIIKGHALVIPKQHCDPITAVPDDLLQHLILIVRKVARAQLDGLQADGVNIVQSNGKSAGQEVPHVHFHIIPRYETDGHKWNWKTLNYNTPDEMQSMAEKIKNNLEILQ